MRRRTASDNWRLGVYSARVAGRACATEQARDVGLLFRATAETLQEIASRSPTPRGVVDPAAVISRMIASTETVWRRYVASGNFERSASQARARSDRCRLPRPQAKLKQQSPQGGRAPA